MYARSTATVMYGFRITPSVRDGTFQMAPDTSYQVYTLHGYVNGEALALTWALLPNNLGSPTQKCSRHSRMHLPETLGTLDATPS